MFPFGLGIAGPVKPPIKATSHQGKGMDHNNRISVLGLMSGTSLDGIDAAVVDTDGVDIFGFGECRYAAYDAADQQVIRAGLGAWPGDAPVAAVADLIERRHHAIAAQFTGMDLVGFHGQTLAHDPDAGRTHQCGNGGTLATLLGTPVAWDFRSNDVACGGQGAPLAPVFHHALVRYLGMAKPVAILNLGGVGNVTFVDPTAPPESGLLAFDTGPANAPMNDIMQRCFDAPFDTGGAHAAQGTVDRAVLARFQTHAYFKAPPPKSLDRDEFAGLVADCAGLPPSDALATLSAACVWAVAVGVKHAPMTPHELWVTGGGRHNQHIMGQLAQVLNCPVLPIDAHGANGDMLEAQAFAYLAARVQRGLPLSYPATTGVAAPTVGGRISKP